MMEIENILPKAKLPELEVLQQNLNDVEWHARMNNHEIFGKTAALAPMMCKITSVLGILTMLITEGYNY